MTTKQPILIIMDSNFSIDWKENFQNDFFAYNAKKQKPKRVKEFIPPSTPFYQFKVHS